MVASFGDVVLAARGTSIYSATPGGSSWTSRDSGRTVQVSITLKDLTLTAQIR